MKFEQIKRIVLGLPEGGCLIVTSADFEFQYNDDGWTNQDDVNTPF